MTIYMYNGIMKRKQPKKRIWMPKCRAATFADRRTKRNHTRASQNSKAINFEYSQDIVKNVIDNKT